MKSNRSVGSSLGKMSIRTLFPLIFSGTIAICIVCLLIITYQYVAQQIFDNAKADSDRQLESLSAGIEREITEMTDLMSQAYQVIKSKDYLSDEMDSDLSLFSRQHAEEINGLYLYTAQGQRIWGTEEDTENKQDVVQKAWFQNVQDSIESIYFAAPRLNIRKNGMEYVIPVAQNVEIAGDGVPIDGVLRMDFRMQALSLILNHYGSTLLEYCYVLDADGNLLYHPDQKRIQSGMREEWTTAELCDQQSCVVAQNDGKKWMIATQKIGYTGWKLVIVRSLTDIQRKNSNVYQGIWMILCTMGIVLIVLDMFFLNQITRPVSRLSQAMALFGIGKLEERAPEEGVGELRILSARFNTMAQKIQDLMTQIIRNEQEKRRMERQLLQSQITPHFLYNTLDSIIWMIQSGQYEGAGKMVSLLAKFFRISLSQGKDIIPLRKELEHAVSYLSIQNIRFQDKFEFSVEAEDGLLEFLCPKLTIQPMLENAVYHGMEGMYEDGEISISIYEQAGQIVIDVADNGCGMTEEQVEYILHHDVASSKRGAGIGVSNVDKRIKLLYGPQYGVTISSVLDEGTTVHICIPKRRETDET